MELIKEIFRNKNLEKNGVVLQREAVRAVIFNSCGKLLMIFSEKRGDYKLPGGGIKGGETHMEALKREVQEESGLTIGEIIKELGLIIEYKEARDTGYDIFKMNSYYYKCQAKGKMEKPKLDEYEVKLGFSPVWVHLDNVLEKNKKALESEFGNSNSWAERETIFLEWLKENMDKGS